ncbi:unnamed protein product, partial [Meganyctiphanes norvegica]
DADATNVKANTAPDSNCGKSEEKNVMQKKIVLFDTRAQKEFFVSHLENAHWVGEEPTDTQVALNSENLAQKAFVHNLEGSIFKWANEGRPMINNDGNSTKLCHPYNTVFGLTLNKDLKKYE